MKFLARQLQSRSASVDFYWNFNFYICEYLGYKKRVNTPSIYALIKY